MNDGFRTIELLSELGFQQATPGQLHDWEYQHGPLHLFVIEGVNRWLQPSLTFNGQFNDGRTMALVEFSIGLEAKSRHQALALIGYYLRGLPTSGAPPWIEEALALSDHLPWARNDQEPRHKCSVTRDWFRLPCKTMRSLAETIDTEELAEVFFDGQSLRISARNSFVVMPAEGAAWDRPIWVELRRMRFLPKRLMHHLVEVALWEAHLSIAGLRLNIVEPDREPSTQL